MSGSLEMGISQSGALLWGHLEGEEKGAGVLFSWQEMAHDKHGFGVSGSLVWPASRTIGIFSANGVFMRIHVYL